MKTIKVYERDHKLLSRIKIDEGKGKIADVVADLLKFTKKE